MSSKQLASITNLNDCSRLLHETIAKERAIEAELDKQLSKRSDLERNILLLNATTSEVGSAALVAVHRSLGLQLLMWQCSDTVITGASVLQGAWR